jgi:hypothetical protein
VELRSQEQGTRHWKAHNVREACIGVVNVNTHNVHVSASTCQGIEILDAKWCVI